MSHLLFSFKQTVKPNGLPSGDQTHRDVCLHQAPCRGLGRLFKGKNVTCWVTCWRLCSPRADSRSPSSWTSRCQAHVRAQGPAPPSATPTRPALCPGSPSLPASARDVAVAAGAQAVAVAFSQEHGAVRVVAAEQAPEPRDARGPGGTEVAAHERSTAPTPAGHTGGHGAAITRRWDSRQLQRRVCKEDWWTPDVAENGN